jgi:F-type H+-transporting ATPase subunit delta
MRPTVSQYAEVLEELSRDSGAEVQEVAKNFLGFLKRRGETKKLASIVRRLEERAQEKSGELSVTAVTAHPASAETKTLLAEVAEKVFPEKKIDLIYQTDENVIGGVLLRTREALFDATLATRAKALKQALRKS